MVGTDYYKTFIGDEVIDKRSVIRAVRPINRGVIENWDEMQKIWQHCFYKELKKAPNEHKVFMTEPPLNPKKNREKMAEILFEEFEIPYFFIGV
jgi:actin-related protein